MRRVRKQKNIIIMVVMLALFIMASGYAIYQKRLDIGGIANIDYKDWNIRILSIDTVDSSNGVDVVKPSHTNTTAKFNSKITKVGGFIKYKIVVKNSGTIDGVLGNVSIEETEDSVITYTIEGANIDDELKVGEEATIYVTATYDSSKVDTASTNKSNVTLNLTYVQLEGYIYQTGYLATRTEDSTYWMTEKLPNDSIESIEFRTSNDVPVDAGENYFDASVEQNGSIMGWFYDADLNGKYEVYVGQNGGVRANTFSSYLFHNLTSLTSLDVSNLNTSYASSLAWAFKNLTSLETLDVSSLETYNVTNFAGMFEGNTKLKTLNLGDMDVSKGSLLYDMFKNCQSLEELDVSKFVITARNISGMFQNCHKLKTLDVSNWNTISVQYMQYLFSGCTEMETLDVSNWNTSNVVNMSSMFGYMEKIETLDVSNWDVSKVKKMGTMFYHSYLLKNIDVSNWNTASLNESYYLFCGTSIENLDLSKWNMSNVTSMWFMFSDMPNLKSVNISNWNVSNVKDMTHLFYDSTAIENVDLGDWDTSSLIRAYGMFRGCTSLKSVNLSGWDFSGGEDLTYMFYDCPALESVNLENTNVKGVKEMTHMFSNAASLKELDLSSWDTSAVTSTGSMFSDNTSLKTIYVSDLWNNDANTFSSAMFSDAISLVGGSGVTYNSTKTDVSMANYETGYFTYKKYEGPTPESCFTFNSSAKKITGYDIETCGVDVIIPSKIGGVEVQVIGAFSFSNMGVNSVVIPDSVTEIQGVSFDMNDMTSVTIGKNVKTIGDGAFEYNMLTEVVLPEGIESLGIYAFYENNISKINLPTSLTYIGEAVLNSNKITGNNAIIYARNNDGSIDNTKLISYADGDATTFSIPNTVTTIADYALESNSLKTVTIPNSVKTIGDWSFGSNRIENLVIPDSVISIGESAFNMNQLKTVTIGSGVTSIGKKAFYVTNNGSNRYLEKIINKPGIVFDWGLIINDATGYNFASGVVTGYYRDITITTS